MHRSDRCRNAASTITSIATRRLSPAVGRPDREAREEIERGIADVLYRSFAGKPEHAIDDLLDEAGGELVVQAAVDGYCSGYHPTEDDPAFRSPADRLRKAMTEALRELDELTSHVCTFSEESPDMACSVCGTPGLV